MLNACKHQFHTDCVIKWLEKKAECPLCKAQIAKLFGTQPRSGATMTWYKNEYRCHGFEDT